MDISEFCCIFAHKIKVMNFEITELSDFSGEMAHREIAARINKAIIDKDIVVEQDGSLTINYWEDEDD